MPEIRGNEFVLVRFVIFLEILTILISMIFPYREAEKYNIKNKNKK